MKRTRASKSIPSSSPVPANMSSAKQPRVDTSTQDSNLNNHKTKPSALSAPSLRGNERKKVDCAQVRINKNEQVIADAKNTKKSSTNAPWENFQPFSPKQTSWMLQEVLNETRENRRLMDQILMLGNKKSDVFGRNGFTVKRILACRESDEDELETEEPENDSEVEDPLKKVETVMSENEEEEIEVEVPEKDEKRRTTEHEIMDRPTFPLERMDILNKIEDVLSKDPKFGSRLINNEVLVNLESDDSQQMLNNILSFLISVNLAVQFTYTGKMPLRSFKMLLLCDVIKQAVQKKFPDLEESFFANRIGSWLSGCKRKHSRKIKHLTN